MSKEIKHLDIVMTVSGPMLVLIRGNTGRGCYMGKDFTERLPRLLSDTTWPSTDDWPIFVTPEEYPIIGHMPKLEFYLLTGTL